MQYIEAPDMQIFKHPVSLFLAGGITDCPDWQRIAVKRFADLPLTIVNPRRENFPIHDKNAAFDQIEWEFGMLNAVSHILFWFCKATLCPIVLYEYGRHLARNKAKLFVGIEPGYARTQDVVIQAGCVDKVEHRNTSIVLGFDDLIMSVRSMNYGKKDIPETDGLCYNESGSSSNR